MKSIFKLTLGEFKKLWKSYTLQVMAGLLIACIILMSVVYATQEENVNTLIQLFVGGGPEMDSFDILEGNFKELKDAGVDVTDLERFSEQLKDKPEIKMLLIGVNPSVLQAVSAMGSGSGMDAGDIVAGFASLDEVQRQIYYDNFRDYLFNATYRNTLLDEQVREIKDSNYTISFIDIVKKSYEDVNEAYLELAAPEGAYYAYRNAVQDGESEETISALWEDLIDAVNKFNSACYKFDFYTYSDAVSTNYLLMPTTGFRSEDYSALASAKRAVDTSALTEFRNYLKAREDYAAVYNFFDTMTGGLLTGGLSEPSKLFPPDNNPQINITNPMQTVIVEHQKTASRAAYRMLSGIERLIQSSEQPESLFYCFEPEIQSKVLNYLNSGNGNASKEINDFIKKYNVELKDGELSIDYTAPVFKVFDASYTAVITKEIYEREIKPYYDDSEKQKLTELKETLDGLLAQKTDAEMFAMATSLDITDAQKKELMDLYSGIQAAFKEYAARTETIFTLVKNINFSESIRENNLNDSQTRRIFGFLINSRYRLNSSITQAQFLIESGSLSTAYAAPENLTDGYGAVQFIYILTNVIILIYGIVIAAGTIAGEHSDGTMKLLLIRPHTRTQVLTSKFLTVVLALLGFYIINFGVSVAVGAIFWGLKSSYDALTIFNSTTAIVMHPAWVLVWMQLFGYFEAVIFALIALTISTVAKSRSVSIAVSMLVFFLSFVLGAVLSSYVWYKYIIFNNTNLFMYMSSAGPTLADMNLWFSLIVDIIYSVGLAFGCYFTFVKRDVS